MPPAVRVAEPSNHGGMITGPGVANILISGKPVVVGDMHVCPLLSVSCHSCF